jgi:hypothetical protein
VKKSALVVALTAVLAAALSAGASGAPKTVTVAQLKSSFKKATGQALVVDRTFSSPGRYTAFNLGVQTTTKKARYGTFTIYLVSGGDVAADVEGLLVDPHTDKLGTPAAGGIYWEKDTTIRGDEIWMAKRPYGSNVVLWWSTTSPVRKTDRTWTTLHRALNAATKGG